jgi:hypothetical protein
MVGDDFVKDLKEVATADQVTILANVWTEKSRVISVRTEGVLAGNCTRHLPNCKNF